MSSDLSQLSIDRKQRPADSNRGRLGLALLVFGGIVAGVAGLWWYYSTTGVNVVAAMTEPPVEVSLVTLKKHDSDQSEVVLVATGKIVSDLQVNIATKVSGQIVALHVEQGDTVEKGQVLASIEDVTYRAQRDESVAFVAQNKHAVARAKAELIRAQAAVLERQADLEYEQRNYQRLEGLRKNGQAGDFEFFNAKNQYEAAHAAHEQAKAATLSAESQIRLTEAELEAAQAGLSVREKRLYDCDIRAPVSGVILERNAQIGDFLAAEGGRGANANAQLVEIADMSKLRVEIDVSERDINRLSPRQMALITPDADREHSYHGQIMWIDPIGDYARATVQVKVRILNPGPKLRIDGSAKVEFLSSMTSTPTTGDTNTYWLPKQVVKTQPGESRAMVFTVIDGKAVAHEVDLGTRSDKSVEVLGGVYPGMQLIAENVDELEDGSKVKVTRSRRLEDL